MRKLWFSHLARALVVFPGGFGTLDELTEVLTLSQTHKLARQIPVLLYGTSFWNEIINFDALVRHGVIAEADMRLFRFADSPAEALSVLKEGLTEYYLEPEAAIAGLAEETPEIAHTRTS